jgi:hypothetical protein
MIDVYAADGAFADKHTLPIPVADPVDHQAAVFLRGLLPREVTKRREHGSRCSGGGRRGTGYWTRERPTPRDDCVSFAEGSHCACRETAPLHSHLSGYEECFHYNRANNRFMTAVRMLGAY